MSSILKVLQSISGWEAQVTLKKMTPSVGVSEGNFGPLRMEFFTSLPENKKTPLSRCFFAELQKKQIFKRAQQAQQRIFTSTVTGSSPDGSTYKASVNSILRIYRTLSIIGYLVVNN